jgi:hypothetical protein
MKSSPSFRFRFTEGQGFWNIFPIEFNWGQVSRAASLTEELSATQPIAQKNGRVTLSVSWKRSIVPVRVRYIKP